MAHIAVGTSISLVFNIPRLAPAQMQMFLFLIGLALSSALILHEWRFTRDGMFHHELFGNRSS
jgi:hypothetical protein